ncbi:MAG: pyridine nucleotide-disulfide oxidoreductase [Salinarimonadaceae bacterium]|nr:MAG: pyridine nucleotide-disulfide oxidoreductase [Salinarimonadaceae bacterium]
MSELREIVIVGAGHAGVQAASALRDEGFSGSITLLDGEGRPPYQRPPLSKAYMSGEADAASLALRAPDFFAKRGINLVADRAVAIARDARSVVTASGARMAYDHLVLATGAEPRRPPFPVASGARVFNLATLADAEAIKAALPEIRSVVIVGGGFIGLEFASFALKAGITTHVVDAAERLMARVVSRPVSDFFLAAYREAGADVRLRRGVASIERCARGGVAVTLSDGERIATDASLLGIGVSPRVALAQSAGLACLDGILVDARLTTSDPAIHAIGDCARFPFPGEPDGLRLESVQNASDQAARLARILVGRPDDNARPPWFWSDQLGLKLQIVGLGPRCDRHVLRGDPTTKSFSVFGYERGVLKVVEAVSRPGEYVAAKAAMERGVQVSPEEVADPDFDLRNAIKARIGR